MSAGIVVTTAEGVARITIDRADKRNALTHPMMQALADAVHAADADPQVRALLLDSTGKTFCAGADLANLSDNPPDGAHDPGHVALLALASARKPIVAAVQGAAIGMGATLLLHCDAIYAAPEASLRMPFVELGLTPEAGATFLLPRRIGHVAAARLMLLAEAVAAAEALAMGLVTAVVAAHDLPDVAAAAAARLAAVPPHALATTKAMMVGPDLLARMDAEQDVFRAMLRLPEFADRIARLRAAIRA